MEYKIIVPTNNVQGDITSCKIENQLTRIDRGSAFSLFETNSYISYDVCSKKVIDTYQVQAMTGLSISILIFLGIILFFVMLSAIEWLF